MPVVKVNCSMSEMPVRSGEAIMFRPDQGVSITVPIEHARHFYAISITHDSTTKDAETSCGFQIKAGPSVGQPGYNPNVPNEYFFEFPMTRMDKAMAWFQELHAILSPFTNMKDKLLSCVN